MAQEWEGELLTRFQLATFLEAVRLYDEGIANAEDIDIAMRAGAGLPMGPFAWADETGLDVILEQLQQLTRAGNPNFAPPESLTDKVARGQLGNKSKRGYLRH
ncbi:MAG: 3-hydroxyacyl-CoA dehydrogenase [Sulfobacillus benefaciens]|uniref:3-hydroxyacyl-CoA dehydrogenase n=1 Tax=Sulfobacillus benefaciens TaxID=453960 RepID=A0A2T2XED7_9FIRM|nr:MAG: 3-hydroxyacyl-CoA dehydrogenase [Sulfobacillus benefaciens]